MITRSRNFVRYLSGKEWFDVRQAIHWKINDGLKVLRDNEKHFPDPTLHPEKISVHIRLESSISYDLIMPDFIEILKGYGFYESSSVEILSSLPKGTVELTFSWKEPGKSKDPWFSTANSSDLFAMGTDRMWFTKERTEDMGRNNHLEIKKVIFNEPATIVLWNDGTKTVVKTHDKEKFDPEKGLAMAVSKKVLGTNKSGSNYYDVFEKWIPEKPKKVSKKVPDPRKGGTK